MPSLCYAEIIIELIEEEIYSLPEIIEAGLQYLIKLTGKDFGLDLHKWHKYLRETKYSGYHYYREELPKIMQEVFANEEWLQAAKEIKTKMDLPEPEGGLNS